MLNVVDVQCREYYGDFPMNVLNIVATLMVQRRRFGANISMDVSFIMNVSSMQRRVYCDDYSMDVFNIVTALVVQRRRFGANISMDVFAIENVTTMQRRRCCVLDSPGLARNEPTPGKRSQGDSTLSVLSFFYEGTLTMKHFMADYTKKPQHLWRCSTHNIHYSRIACTIVWQPWAIENATPMVLARLFHNTIKDNIRINK